MLSLLQYCSGLSSCRARTQSLLLCMGFYCRVLGVKPRWAGFSSWDTWIQQLWPGTKVMGSTFGLMGLVAPWVVVSSFTRDWIRMSSVPRQILNYYRKLSYLFIKKYYFEISQYFGKAIQYILYSGRNQVGWGHLFFTLSGDWYSIRYNICFLFLLDFTFNCAWTSQDFGSRLMVSR